MDSPFLPRCPKCGCWPMAAAEVDHSFHTHVKFVCSGCGSASNSTIRRATTQEQVENLLGT